MTTTIYYFTGSGNTLQVARQFAEILGDTELISICQALKNNHRSEADSIGIFFPAYNGDMPPIVYDFIKTLPKNEKLIQLNCVFSFLISCLKYLNGILVHMSSPIMTKNSGLILNVQATIPV